MTHGLDDPGQASDLRRVPSTEPATERHGLSPGGGSFRRSILGPTVLAGIASALLVWFWPQPVRAADTQSVPGQQLFDQHCASCHQAAGQGVEGTFPPLAGNPAAADEAYVESVIRDGLSGPIEVGGVGYNGVMPAVAALTDSGEIQQVTQYVAGLAAPSADAQDGGPDEGEGRAAGEELVAGPVAGDVDRGHDLFVGSTRLANGGPACAACHTAGSVGNLGGQSLGPDLTDTFQTLGGEAGLTGWLANPPSPTMQPLFADRPLSETEVADVVAFLGDAPNQSQPTTSYDRLIVAALGGLVSLIAGMTLAWRGMRQTYVERLRTRPGGSTRRHRPQRRRTGTGAGARGGPAALPHPERQQQTSQSGGSSR